jgi:hypothetical protein
MPRKRVLSKKSVRGRNCLLHSAFSRRLGFQALEDRRLLTAAGYFDQIADDVSGPHGAMSVITSGLQAVDSITRLPLINQPISQIGELTGALTSFQSNLDSALRALSPASTQHAVQQKIYDLLGPEAGGADVLTPKRPATADPAADYVVATISDTGVDISIDIGFTSATFDSAIGLGVDSVPLKPADNSNGKFSVGLKYQDFHFGYNTTDGVFFRTDTSNNELQLTLNGFLPPTFSAGLGFLNVLVTDRTPGIAPEDADLSLTVTSDVTGGFGANDPPISISTPHLGGGLVVNGQNLAVNLDVDVEVQATAIGDGMPKIKTELVFQWALPDVSASVPLGTSWGAPLLQFNHVQIELGSLLGNLARPIADDVESILEPLQPVFDILQAPIPGVSDFSEAVGNGKVNLLSLDTLLQNLPGGVLPQGITDVLNEAHTLIKYYNTIHDLVSVAGGWIDVGNFKISGPSGASLLDPVHTLNAALGDLGLKDWSDLIGDNPGAAFSSITDQISHLVPGAVGDEINSLWEQFNPSPSDNGLSFTYPIVTNPGDVLLGMLLGKDKDLVTAKINYKEDFDESFPIPIIPLFFIQVTADAKIDAFAQVGYDLRGLRESMAPFYKPTPENHGSFDAGKLLDGLWIAPTTHFHLDSTFEIGAGFGVPHAVTFDISGGLNGTLDVNISNPNSLDKIRPFAGDLTAGLFDVNNQLYGILTCTLKVGVDTPAGFLGFDKTWTFDKALLFQFTSDHIDVPTTLIPPPVTPPVLFQYFDDGHTLVLNATPGDVNESFTVNHVSHIVFRGSPAHPNGLVFDTFYISSGGINQQFTGQVDRVYAHLGGGNDTLDVVDDTLSPTLYQIYGDDGDDTIDIEGACDVQLYGGAGHDTIQAGNGGDGTFHDLVDGGPDSDNITFGEGVLSNMAAGADFYIVRSDPNDQSLDRVTIDNSRSKTNAFYRFYQNLNGFDKTLDIQSDEAGVGVDRLFHMSQYDPVTIYGGSAQDEFSGIPATFSKFYGGPGNDSFFTGGDDHSLPVGPNTVFDFPTITFDGGAGSDQVDLNDTGTHTPRSYSLGVSPNPDAQAQIYWFDSGLSGFRDNLIGIEETDFTADPANTVEVDGWDTGLLQLDDSNVRLAANSSMWWDTKIVVLEAPKITFFDGPGNNSQSGGGIDENGPYLFLQGDHRIDVEFHQDVGAVTTFDFQTDVTVLDLTPTLLTRPWNIMFDGPAHSTLYIVAADVDSPTETVPNFNYLVTADEIVINSYLVLPDAIINNFKAFTYSNLETIRIQSGQGNDNLEVDGHPPQTLIVVYDGRGGTDSLNVDDHLDTTNSLWSISPNFVGDVLHFSVTMSNVESTQVLGGKGNDLYIVTDETNPVARTFDTPLILDGGGGNDTFTLGEANFPATFEAPVRIDGNDGDDTFTWYGINNASDAVTHLVTVDGGSGLNTLVVDDQTRFTSPTNYDIYADRIRGAQIGYGVWEDFNYAHMGAIALNTSSNNDVANVYGISSDITVEFAILGHGGDDSVIVHPRDAADNPTINGELFVSGGDGTDHVTIDSSASTQASNYSFIQVVGYPATIINGVGPAAFLAGSDVEQLEVRGGSGDDTFRIDDYINTSTALSIAGGAGDDVVQITPLGGNVSGLIDQAADFAFDGGGGTDSINVYNSNSAGTWTYVRDENHFSMAQISPNYFLAFNLAGFENMSVAGGTQLDNFILEALPSGQSLSFNGGAGLDYFNIGFLRGNAKEIQGQVIVDGGDDGTSLIISDTATTTSDIIHIDDNGTDGTLGGALGDTLFGPGGSLRYRNLADGSNGVGLSLALTPAADTIYAKPLTTATLAVFAGEPSEGNLDTLNLALAGVQNPVIVDGSGRGIGHLTSTNRKTVQWSGVEQVATDYVAPSGFLVTNTLDSGPGSLRQALLDANTTANVGGPNVIRFSIPGVGAHTIRPLSPLPGITDPLVLDATTQPGFAGKPIIELDGSLAGGSNGLFISSGGTTVRGLAINRFVAGANADIWIQGPGGNVIQGNYLGTNLAGNALFPFASQSSYGVVIFGSDANVIGTNGDGTNDAAEGNVISGHNTAGILLEVGQPGELPDNNVIAGNRIGTSADGNTALLNGRMGVFFIGAGTGNRIGTNSDGVSDTAERNLISGNTEAGIFVDGDGNVIAGNYIGTNAAGNAPLGNGDGIRISASDNNRVGGTAAGAGNVIAFNTSRGVAVDGVGAGNSVLGNSIFANGEIGIDLAGSADLSNRVTPNDTSDADTGPNNLQNYPQITTAFSSGTQTTVAGTFQSTPRTNFRIEFFASATADPSGHGEGQTYLGFVSATTDSSGIASIVASFSTAIPLGQFISATATDPAGNTSEFATDVQVVASSSLPNVAPLRVPQTGAAFLVTSPAGTSITASVSSTAGVAPPNGIEFPFGFVTFAVRGVAQGAAVNVTLSGLDTSQIIDYDKYGPTPVTHAAHWYEFKYGQATDRDSAVGTGMEIVSGTIVLHLIDGGRGDDDLAANGVIADVGGPVRNQPPVAKNDTANTYKNVAVVINVLGNDADSDGTVKSTTVAIVGAAGHGTTSVNSTTGGITYTPAANYTGPDSFTYKVKDNNGADSNVATVSITVIPTGTIAGTDYLDVTGNGLTADDTPLASVKVYLDTNNNGAWNTGEPTTNTLPDGSYAFAGLVAGTYKVRQVTPAGYVRTAPATVDYYSVALATGQTSSANNFSNAALGNSSVLSNVVYVINGTTPVSDLRGTTKEGDIVQVSFTVVAGVLPQRFTLVSYTAPGSAFDASTAAQQQIFDSDSGVFGAGTYTLTVSNPHSYFQVDFVSGYAIDKLGPAGSNIFYSAQTRLFSADNGGTHAVLASPASLTGSVYRDANNSGTIDSGEQAIAGVKVTATAGSTTQTAVTDMYGAYTFDNLPAGTYTITETQPGDYTDGKDTLGNKGGTATNDKFSGIVLAASASGAGYNFGEQQTVGSPFAGNQTQTTAWWNGSNGQALIKALNGGPTAKNLGNWLASNFNNLFGADAGSANNLAGKTNAQVAAYYQSLYSSSARKPEAEALALALAVYVTNSSLAGTTPTSYGFAVSATGLGTATVSVGVNGAAFGVNNNTVVTIAELLSRTNARARKGAVWDANADGSLNAAENVLRTQASSLFDTINNT